MAENEIIYETLHDNALSDKIYTISNVTFVQLRIYPPRQDCPTIGNAVFDVKLNANGSIEIANIPKNYKVVMVPC